MSLSMYLHQTHTRYKNTFVPYICMLYSHNTTNKKHLLNGQCIMYPKNSMHMVLDNVQKEKKRKVYAFQRSSRKPPKAAARSS